MSHSQLSDYYLGLIRILTCLKSLANYSLTSKKVGNFQAGSAIRNPRLKTLLSPVPARTDFQSHPVVHASSTDICIRSLLRTHEVPVSTCVRLLPVPMCLTVHFLYRLTGCVQKAKPFAFNIQSCVDISIMFCATVWTCPFSNT